MFLEIDEDFATHPKTLRLAAKLMNPTAGFYMLRLWSWARKYQKDGDLTAYEPEEIEIAVGWTLDPGKFYSAAVVAGFIDETRNGDLVTERALHNWMERTGGAIRRMEEAASARKDRRRRWNDKRAADAGDGFGDCLGLECTPNADGTPPERGQSADTGAHERDGNGPRQIKSRLGKSKQDKTSQEPETESAETAPPSSPPVMMFPCDGEVREWALTQPQIDEWSGLFPALDVVAICRQALAWVKATPAKRKTATGMPRFLVAWFTRDQNRRASRGGTVAIRGAPAARGERNVEAAREWLEGKESAG